MTYESNENLHVGQNNKYELDSDCNVDLEEADELNSDNGQSPTSFKDFIQKGYGNANTEGNL